VRKSLLGVFCLIASFSSAAVSVQVAAPLSNSALTSPFSVHASATSSHPITGWQVYLDSVEVYTGPPTGTITATIKAAPGAHLLTISAWDATGAYGTHTVAANVAAPAPPPPPVVPISVKVSAPVNYSSGSSPIHLQATAAGSHAVTGWQVYLDGAIAYTGPATGTIAANINAAAGTHQIIARAWDTTGAFADQTVQATVAAAVPPPANPLPTPPATAKVFSNIEQTTTGWASCNTPGCAGGSGAGTYWQAFNQTTPAMDGQSMEIFQSGVWSDALWYHKVGANNAATNFLWDFYVQLDTASVNAAQALEYDAFQFVGGYNYMIGTECNYAAGVWDTWNESTGQWLHTTVPCKKFSTGAWHHIQWYMTNDHSAHTYTYKTLVVDGVAYTFNQTQPAKYVGWADDTGVQWQLDVNASGTGYHEWVDQAKLTIW